MMHMSWDADPYTVDITEIEGFDDLHHAEGILKEAQERQLESIMQMRHIFW